MQSAPQYKSKRLMRQAVCALVLALGVGAASAFSLLGPVNEGYQVPEIGYNLPGDVGAPKNIGEEYRYNTPVLYYAFNQTFIDYFGTNGMHAVDDAIGMLNSLTNTAFEDLDPNLFPTEGIRINPLAQSLNLLDLKSVTIHLMLEELGLAEPERWVWTLRDRRTQPGLSCPYMIYDVIMRNFDPITANPSAYINGVLYTYLILERCNPPNPIAVTDNFPVDVAAPEYSFTALAGMAVAQYGAYAVGLTRDDVGGLQYLYRRDNVNWESPAQGSEMILTNRTQAQLIYSSNLWEFASIALTNDAVTLQTFYPGLVITGTTNIFVNVWVTNLTAYFTNYPWTPVDSFPQLVFKTNRTLTIQTHYIHSLANAYTGLQTENGIKLVPVTANPTVPQRVRAYLETISVTNSPWLPLSANVVTNVSLTPIITNGFYGDFFILPTNACSFDIIGLQATLVTAVTNTLVSTTNNAFTNLPPIVNVGTSTNTAIFQIPQFSQNLITLQSNRVWLGYPVECVTSNQTLLRGVDRLQFIRTSYDSLIGRYYRPFTNIYTLVEVTNSVLVTNYVRRVVSRPDFLFGSFDMKETLASRSQPNWSTNSANGLAGPGVISPPVNIDFNRVGPLIINYYRPGEIASGLNQSMGLTNFIWGSYNGSPTAPIIYPYGTQLSDIETILLFQILTADLPDGSVGVPYSTQLLASGGQPPYSWAPNIDSAPLPPGLTLSSTGVISGTPEAEGDYTFSVTVTESGGRTTTRTLTMHITP